MTRIYFFKSNGLTKKDQVKMTKEVTNLLSDTAKRRQKDGNETATSDKVIIRTSLGHFLRYVAMIFAVLVMSIANIGVAWGKTWNVSLSGSGVSQDGITLTGDYAANASVGSSSKKANSFNTNNSSAYIFSEQKNITAISFTVCRNTNGASANNAVTVATSTGGAFAVQTSNFTATNNGSSISSLTNIQAVGNNQANQNTIVITFADGHPVQAIEFRKASASLIFNISVTYEDETLPSSIFNATISGSTPAATVTPAGTSLTLSVNSSSPKTIGSDKYYQWNGDNVISLGSGKFQAGDIIIADVCGSGNNKAAGFKVNGGSTEYIVTFSASSHGQVFYTVSAGDGVAGQSSVTLKRKSSDTYVHAFRVLRSGAAPEPSCDEITPSLSYDHPTLVLTQTTTANPTLDKDGSAGAVTWTSSNTDVATVNSSGVVTAKGAGSATITASIAANGDNCAGEATATINVAAAPLGIVDQKLATGNVAWDASVIVTSNPTNITSLTALSHHGTATASGNGNTSNGGQTSKIGTATGDFNASNYLELSFTVASGKRLNVSSVAIPVQPVTSSTNNFRAVLSDNQGSSNIEGSTTNQTQGTLSNITFSSFGTLKGTVTLRIYAWGWSNGYRLGKNIVIDGTIEDDVTPSCTAPSSVAISGTSSYLPGQNISLTAAATGGSGTPTTYQWYHRGVAIDGATSATYTKSKCTIDDAGNYTCKVTMGGSCSTTSPNFAVRVYSVKVWSNGGGSVIGNYPLTYQSSNNGRAVISTLSASTTYEFKVIDNVGGTSDSTIYYGNGGTIHHNTSIDPATWDFGSTTATNCKLVTGVETGDFTFDVDITHNGTGAGFYVTVNVAYPTKTIYLTPGVWNAEGAKFAFHYYDANGGTGWTDFLTANDCGMSSEIPVWDGVKMIAGRFNSTKASTGNWDDKWNQTNDITVSSYNSVVITGWNEGDYTYNSNFSTPTYTISYNAGTGGSGTKASETKTCGVDFTLPGSTFTYAGHTQDGWATTDGGTIAYALSGSYTTNDDEEFFPHWKCNTPTITDNGDNTVTITVPAGTTVRYTTDGSAPTSSNGTEYSSAFTIDATVTVKAIAYQSGCTDSEVASQACTYHAPVEGCIDANSTNFGAGNSSGDASKTLADGTVVAMNKCTNSASSVSIGGNILFTAPTGKAFETFSFVATCGSAGKTNYYKINGGSQQSLESSTTTAKTYTITIPGATNATTIQIIKNGTTPAVSSFCYTLKDICTSPTTAFANGAYTVGGSALDLSTLISGKQGSGTITYTVKNANGTGAAIDGSNFTATSAGTATVTATQAANGGYCEKVMNANVVVSAGGGGCTQQSVVKTVLSSTTEGTTTGYNNDEYAGDPTIVTFEDNPVNGGYKLKSKSKLFVTLKKGSFVAGDKINIVITKASDLTNTTGKLPIFYNASSPALLTTIDAASAGTYTYTLTASDITTLGSNKTIGVFRSSSTTENNPYVKSVEVEGCRDWTVDETAPTFVSSVPANGATDVATSGTIVLTFSEPLGSVDASKFTLTGATKGAVSIDGSDATKVNIAYSGAANSATVTLATAAAAVSDLAGNALAAALSNISFTTAAAAPATKEIYYGAITITAGALTKGSTGTSQFFTNIGGTIANNTEISWSSGPGTGGEYYESNVLTDTELSKSSNWNTSSGSNRYVGGMKFQSGSTYTLALGSKVASSITFYGRNGSASKTMTVGGEDWTSSATKNTFAKHEFIKTGGFTGNVSITQDGDFYGILVITIQTATPCTTPVIPTLSNQTVCPGSDIAAWNATQTAVLADGETASYSWKKKGNDTELANTASFDLGSSATESQAGTYVVTVTVSKAGKASATATKEVTLTVTAAVEEPVITANKATVYPGNSVTLTATCGTDGVTWNWYLCANADGTGAGSSLGTSSSYTIASAGAAGTYYYKAVATGSCGTAERVYTLTVTAASECEKYFWFVYAADATSNGVINNRDNFFGSSPKTGSSNSGTYKFTLDGTEYTATRNTGDNTFSISFTVPEGSTATLALNCKGSSSKPLYLIPTSGDPVLITDNSSNAAHVVENIAAGTYKVGAKTDASASWTLAGMAVQVCTASSCTDATPTIAAVNNTVCVGTKMRIDATGYEDGASFKWQKLNGSTWDDVAGAILDSLVIASAAAENAGSYRLVATKECARTSNTVTISVPSAPNFGSTVPASVSVMQTIALSINTVEATDAVKYKWYKSADATWDAGDTEIGTNKELIKAYDSEAIGSPSYYIFCRAQNACGITTSSAIAVNVTAYVEEDCATRGNESDAAFSFENSGCGQGTYQSANCYTMNSNGKILVYSAPDGKYFKTAKVTIASSSESKASYNWSTNGGTSYTAVSLTVNSTLTERTINLSAHGNVNAFQIGRNFDSKGSSGGTLYVSKICFEYTDACTATTVTPSTESTSYEMGGEWSNPTFTLSVAGTLTYSSSNEDIASVDDDGTVTFNGEAGTVTITASYAGGTISATEYCASSGSYTINVSCPGGAPKVVADGSVDMSGCNSSVTLHAKKQDGTAFDDGTYQWFRNGTEIDGATSSSYTATQAGTYTVERTNTSDCTTPSTNSAIVTSETTEPEVERLVPFQYYHVDKTYSDQMKMRHLFAVKNSGKLDGKSFKMYVSRNGGAATDVTGSNALEVWPSADGRVDTVMVNLNELSGKYSANDELVFTCKAIDCTPAVSDVYKNTITMRVIGATPTLALICSGSSKAEGTRKTSELTVGGDFLTGYNVADLCQQTGNTSFNANIEWGLYTDLKANYIVTPVNGYAVFNKLNYEPFDILLLTDYPKASKSDAAADVLDDMAALCDYRPMLSFKTHMVAKSPSKWAAKGFTTSPVVSKADGRLNLNIVCYAHPMFASLKTGENVYTDVANTSAPLVYTMLTGEGYEGKKGMQGFELAAAENFVTIGLTHYNATITKDSPSEGQVSWTPGSEDRMLVTVAERQANPEARFILFSLNIGAHSKLTDKGEQVVLACLNYLLGTAEGTIEPADCSFTFDNGENNEHDDAWYANPSNCAECTGTKGDGKWTTAANWGPDYRLLPGEFTSVRIKKPVEVDDTHAHVMEVRIIDEGSIDIPAGKALDVKSTIRRQDGSEIYPTDVNDIHIGSASTGNGTLIFNNNDGDTKARVDMYSTALADVENMSAANSTWQYIGTPHKDVANARSNYYGSWLYQYSGSGWEVIPNGGPLVPFRGYCVTHPAAPVVFDMVGTLVATTAQDITIPAGYTVIANSWVAPIDINAITDDDMEGISDKSIYFFNTGTDADGTAGTGTEAGTYRTTPIHSASYTGDWQIPSMQGFYISTASDGTLHLDYERHVRPTGSRSVVSNPMYAPRRAAAESDEPNVLKIFARGSRYQDKLVVLEREDFTRGYDSGWDGEAWGGGTLSPMVYVTGEGREDAVSAIPEFEGTVVAFKAGEDSEYRFEFVYSEDAEPLYLFDTENNTYTQIMTGNAYYFTTSDKSPHSRFILTRKNPQVATGVEPTSDSSLKGRAKKLLIEDKMFIMVNGMLYDATGKVVK